MRNAQIPDEFIKTGGTELAPMSTTSDLSVALEYSASKSALLLRLNTASFMERGADLQWLSAFPGEVEFLYPPLTFLQPTGREEEVLAEVGGASPIEYRVIEVTPHI